MTPTDLIQFGVLGVVVGLFLAGFIWAKPSVDRLIQDKEKAEAQRDALIEVYQEQVIPILRDTVTGTARTLQVYESVTTVLTEVKALLLSRKG